MISFATIPELPNLQLEPAIDLTYIQRSNAQGGSVFCCYAVARDFLSVPPTYALLEFQSEWGIEIHQMSMDEYLDGFEEDTAQPKPGLYQFNTDDPEIDIDGEDEDDTDVLVLVLTDSVIEITYQTKTLHEPVYHAADSEKALLQFIATANT